MSKQSEIKFKVHLDEQKIPEEIEWEASDAGPEGTQKTSSVMISLWDDAEKNTLSLSLWTKTMIVEDMDLHYLQTFMSMAENYERATNNKEVAQMIREFGQQFGLKRNLIKIQEKK